MNSFECKAYALLLSLFVSGLISAAVISSKIIMVFGLAVPAGAGLFPDLCRLRRHQRNLGQKKSPEKPLSAVS